MINIIGIDCAAQYNGFGITYSKYHKEDWKVGAIKQKLSVEDLLIKLSSFLKKDERTLICFDSPLGWSINMPRFIQNNLFDEINLTDNFDYKISSEEIFKRKTDRIIKKHFSSVKSGFNPFEIGADKIARATLRTFELVDKIKKELNINIQMQWDYNNIQPISVIEVYPTATLLGFDLYEKNYKKSDNEGLQDRKKIIEDISYQEDLSLKSLLEMNVSNNGSYNIVSNSARDAFDSLICAFTGKKFLEGMCSSPKDFNISDLELKTEGWIWTNLS